MVRMFLPRTRVSLSEFLCAAHILCGIFLPSSRPYFYCFDKIANRIRNTSARLFHVPFNKAGIRKIGKLSFRNSFHVCAVFYLQHLCEGRFFRSFIFFTDTACDVFFLESDEYGESPLFYLFGSYLQSADTISQLSRSAFLGNNLFGNIVLRAHEEKQAHFFEKYSCFYPWHILVRSILASGTL